jgi:CO/xanthine dehydrogenase Mo-binding subunit
VSDGRVRVLRALAAVDVGQVINPDGVRNQIEGGIVQSASWTLKEQVRYSDHRIESRDWATYPILRFSEVPEVEVALIDRPEVPFVGAGEAAQGPTAAAIANGVADAVNIRLREVPLTPARVLGALGANA